MILEFKGETEWASNFARGYPVRVFGREWPSSEHAFNAAKFFGVSDEHVGRIAAAATPRAAKDLGRSRELQIRDDWDDVRVAVMAVVVLRKFEQHPALRAALVGTKGVKLVEGNAHGDRMWGAVWQKSTSPEAVPGPDERVWSLRPGGVLVGRNELGKVLMVVRRDLA